jgi:hypothetical protein
MRIEVDQSWKIEFTNKPTILVFSNAKSGSIIIPSREKKLIQKFFRQIDKPRLFIYLTFAAAIYVLIRKCIKNRDQIVIDREYAGYEKLICQKLREFINENLKLKDISISTYSIGKKSPAHLIAYSLKRNRDHKIVAKRVFARDIIRIVKRNLKSGST